MKNAKEGNKGNRERVEDPRKGKEGKEKERRKKMVKEKQGQANSQVRSRGTLTNLLKRILPS
jgi:hypothetical protein